MKVTIIQTTTKMFNESGVLLTTRLNETYLIEPAEDKIIRHRPTGQLFPKGLCINKEHKIQEYEEIDKIED
jgi:hypothetical protein